jgi:DNA invertase Pin-like site-specific DNA recombinase
MENATLDPTESTSKDHSDGEVFGPITKVGLYARVSTGNGQQDPEMQLRELREYVVRRRWEISGEYVDHVSGSKDRRPALDRLIVAAKRREFDVVLVWKLDRFARSLSTWSMHSQSSRLSA